MTETPPVKTWFLQGFILLLIIASLASTPRSHYQAPVNLSLSLSHCLSRQFSCLAPSPAFRGGQPGAVRISGGLGGPPLFSMDLYSSESFLQHYPGPCIISANSRVFVEVKYCSQTRKKQMREWHGIETRLGSRHLFSVVLYSKCMAYFITGMEIRLLHSRFDHSRF